MKKRLFTYAIVFTIIFITVGYSAFQSELFISDMAATVRLEESIRITDLSIETDMFTGEATSYYEDYDVNSISSDINLPYDNSTVTYKITVTNFESTEMVLADITGLPSNLDYDLEGYTLNEKICNDSGKCSLGIKKEFYITIKYIENGRDSSDTEYSLNLNFNFKKIYYVTYENFSSTSGYPTYVTEDGTLSVSFGTLDAPIEVKKSGIILSSSEYSYSNYKLSINNVDGDIHIRKLTKYTIVNKVKNGSFENGLTGWTIIGGSSSATWRETNISHFGSKAYYRDASAYGVNYLRQTLSFTNGHKYYFFAHGICTSEQDFYADIAYKNSHITFKAVPYKYNKGSVIYTADFTGDNYIHINFAKTTDSVIVDGIGMVDLTAAFGAGNEPNLTWCNANINYFDGSKTIYK